MKSLTIGTTNPAKVAHIAGALVDIDVEVLPVQNKDLLPKVVEDGRTAQENAQKKAFAYSVALGTRVLSMDNALYLDGLASDDQPGMHVRRISGEERSTDDELLDYYQRVIGSLGDQIGGRWEFAVCVADPDGRMWDTTIMSPRTFTKKKSDNQIQGYPLESIQIDLESGKYISDMTKEESNTFWQKSIGSELSKFILQLED